MESDIDSTSVELDTEMDTIIGQMHCYMEIPNEVDSDAFVTCDDDMEIAEMPTSEEIIDAEDEADETVSRVTSHDAIKVVNTLYRYAAECDTPQAFLLALQQMDDSCILESLSL